MPAKAGSRASGQRGVDRVRDALALEGVGQPLPDLPQPGARRAVGRDDGVVDVGGSMEGRDQGRLGVDDVGDLDQEVDGVAGPDRTDRAVPDDEVERVAGDELDGVERRERPAEGARQADGDVDARDPEDGHRQAIEARQQAQPCGRDDAERALGPGQQLGQGVAGVVLPGGVQPADDRPVAEHGLDALHLVAGHAVAEHVDAAGVGRDRAADGRRVAGGEVNAIRPSRLGRRPVDGRHRRAGPRHDRPAVGIDVLDRREPAQAEQDGAVARDAAPDEPRVAALGHERDARRPAGAHDLRDLLDAAGPDDGARLAPVPAGPVDLVARPKLRIDEDVRLADDPRQRLR